MGIDLFQIFVYLLLIFKDICAHAQIFFHSHAGKHMPAFRHMGKAHIDYSVGRGLLQILPVQRYRSGGSTDKAGYGVQSGSLSGAVCPYKGHQLPLSHSQ